MKVAIVRFPGSNCDQDCFGALESFGIEPRYVWHKETPEEEFDLWILPGGFSYGDYLRCGAIARFSPVMTVVTEQARRGKLVLGICNGFQILCEARLLPGALIRNRKLLFLCDDVRVRVENIATPFTNVALTGAVLKLPIAHGEGNYVADATTLHELALERRILLRYVDDHGATSDAANANGSANNIAGICNVERNVFGLMPHPERACDLRLGSTDGRMFFDSILNSIGLGKKAA